MAEQAKIGRPRQAGRLAQTRPLTQPGTRYLTQHTPSKLTKGLPRYYWAPTRNLVRLGFKHERIPANWQDYTDGRALLEAAIATATRLNNSMDRLLATKQLEELSGNDDGGDSVRSVVALQRTLRATQSELNHYKNLNAKLADEVSELKTIVARQSAVIQTANEALGSVKAVNIP